MREKCISIGVLAYSESQMASIAGLCDLFGVANRLSREKGILNKIVNCHVIRDVNEEGRGAYTVVVVPPSLSNCLSLDKLDEEVSWITEQHEKGALVCSICAGAFLLGKTGLLDGRCVTTHWAFAEKFALTFPRTRLNIDKLIIDDGDVITAGGLMAWMDLGLSLIERFISPDIMLETARFFIVDPGGREQRFYRVFSPQLNHGDKAILKAQHWLQLNFHLTVNVENMASQAGLSARTFLRRFSKATGLTPSDYLQHLRVGKARALFESSTLSVEEIAWQTGYQDASAFRRVFQNLIGLTPREYRKRFSLNQ
jgi:transcriptional regulator GlxA family with amidase domain